jgi:hypothetical protein
MQAYFPRLVENCLNPDVNAILLPETRRFAAGSDGKSGVRGLFPRMWQGWLLNSPLGQMLELR